jgi:hypothetical protein
MFRIPRAFFRLTAFVGVGLCALTAYYLTAPEPAVGPTQMEVWVADRLVYCGVDIDWAYSVKIRWAVANLPPGSLYTTANEAEDKQAIEDALNLLTDCEPKCSD